MNFHYDSLNFESTGQFSSVQFRKHRQPLTCCCNWEIINWETDAPLWYTFDSRLCRHIHGGHNRKTVSKRDSGSWFDRHLTRIKVVLVKCSEGAPHDDDKKNGFGQSSHWNGGGSERPRGRRSSFLWVSRFGWGLGWAPLIEMEHTLLWFMLQFLFNISICMRPTHK